jgi:hypothetical protein
MVVARGGVDESRYRGLGLGPAHTAAEHDELWLCVFSNVKGGGAQEMIPTAGKMS